MKYLLITYCNEDGYWDTSGHCHWSTPSIVQESEFELDNTEDLIRSIASFKFQYPNGQVSLYKIEEISWDDSNDIIKLADPIIERFEAEEIIAKKEKFKKDKEAAEQRYKALELEQLRKLQEKYKGEI